MTTLRPVLLLLAFLAGLAVFGGLRSCYWTGRADSSGAPELTKKQRRLLAQADYADSLAVVVANARAASALRQRDSALALARANTRTITRYHDETRRLPAATAGPLSAVALRLANYQPPVESR